MKNILQTVCKTNEANTDISVLATSVILVN